MMRQIWASLFVAGVAFSPLSTVAQQSQLDTVEAANFIGPDWMQGPYHTVDPYASNEGNSLIYRITTPIGSQDVKGTVAARTFIREVTAMETLRQRSTVGTIAGSAAGRTINIVGTPVRVVEGLATKAKNISSVEEGVLFLPKEIVNTSGQLLNGVGELAVTGVRITTGAASTKCSGFNCVEKAGEDIWSGFNSLMGKHNSARRLHNEFGTDPQTQNKAYRKQIDRLAYAESYTATTVKIGGANAGVDYFSPAMQYVGWYNNGEFVAGYEDAHRRRNFEKKTYLELGASDDNIEALYRNEAFTKAQRRRLFAALETIPNAAMRLRFLGDTALVSQRQSAERLIAKAEHLGRVSSQGYATGFDPDAAEITYINPNGSKTSVLYSDYLRWSEGARKQLLQDRNQGLSTLTVLGYASPEFIKNSRALGVQVEQIPQ